MGGFKVASIYSKVALLIAIINVVLFISGFGSSYWQVGQTSEGQELGYGLWLRCVKLDAGFTNETLSCLSFDQFDGQGNLFDSILRTARGLMLTSYICLCLTALMGFLYIHYSELHNKWMAFVVTVISYSTAIFCLSGLAVYGNSLVQPNFKLGWSFGMSVIALLLMIPTAVLATIDMVKTRKMDTKGAE